MLITLEEITLAYYDCRKRKRNTVNASLFELDLEENLYQLYLDINNRTYEIGYSICFLIRYPKLREVFAADFRDRIVHHVIINKLEDLFEKEFIYDSYNCRKGKGVLFGVNRLSLAIDSCSNQFYIAKFDFSGFFMSIDKTILWKKLESFIIEQYNGSDKDLLLWLVKKVVLHCPQNKCIRKGNKNEWSKLPKNKSLFTTGNNYGLPIGNLTSQIFANYYLSTFDHLMSELFDFYCRYVDDFVILTKEKQTTLTLIPCVQEYLRLINVSLNPKKTYVQHVSKGCEFTGTILKPCVKLPGKRTITHLYNVIYELNNKNYPESDFIARLNSYYGYMKHNYSYNIRVKASKLISKKWLFKVSKTFNKFGK